MKTRANISHMYAQSRLVRSASVILPSPQVVHSSHIRSLSPSLPHLTFARWTAMAAAAMRGAHKVDYSTSLWPDPTEKNNEVTQPQNVSNVLYCPPDTDVRMRGIMHRNWGHGGPNNNAEEGIPPELFKDCTTSHLEHAGGVIALYNHTLDSFYKQHASRAHGQIDVNKSFVISSLINVKRSILKNLQYRGVLKNGYSSAGSRRNAFDIPAVGTVVDIGKCTLSKQNTSPLHVHCGDRLFYCLPGTADTFHGDRTLSTFPDIIPCNIPSVAALKRHIEAKTEVDVNTNVLAFCKAAIRQYCTEQDANGFLDPASGYTDIQNDLQTPNSVVVDALELFAVNNFIGRADMTSAPRRRIQITIGNGTMISA